MPPSTSLVAVLGLASAAAAHIQVLSPNGGETLLAGGSYRIEWRIVIPHNLEHWNLFYTRQLGSGDWISIVEGLEPGDPSGGSIHAYEWTVPNITDDSVWVRVVMVNDTASYQDASDGPFAIVPGPGSLSLGAACVLMGGRRERRQYRPCPPPCPCLPR